MKTHLISQQQPAEKLRIEITFLLHCLQGNHYQFVKSSRERWVIQNHDGTKIVRLFFSVEISQALLKIDFCYVSVSSFYQLYWSRAEHNKGSNFVFSPYIPFMECLGITAIINRSKVDIGSNRTLKWARKAKKRKMWN